MDNKKANNKGLITQGLIPDWLDRIFLNSVTPLIAFFSRANVNPNWITEAGFVLNVVAAFFIARGKFITGAMFVIGAGIFDFIDGKVAAKLQRKTTYGAILDTFLDRYSDILIYLGIIVYYQSHHFRLTTVVTIVALAGSVMTSFIKAVGESFGIKSRMGVLRRQERITLICIGLVFTFLDQEISRLLQNLAGFVHVRLGLIPVMPLTLVIWILAIFTNCSALQRFVLLLRIAREQNPVPPGSP